MNQRNCSPDCELNQSSECVGEGSAPIAQPLPTWLGGGIAVLDANGRVLNVNDSLANWLADSSEKLKGKELAQLLGLRHSEWQEPIEKILHLSDGFDRLELTGQSGS